MSESQAQADHYLILIEGSPPSNYVERTPRPSA